MTRRSPRVLIFVHLPKCAGTTICAVLRDLYGNRYRWYVDSYRGWLDVWRMMQRWDEDAHDDLALCGHHTWGIHDLLPHKELQTIVEQRHADDMKLYVWAAAGGSRTAGALAKKNRPATCVSSPTGTNIPA